MAHGLSVLGGVLLILLQSVLLQVFGVRIFMPQVAVFLVVYFALRRDFDHGAIACLTFAFVADLCSGGPRGYLALGLTTVFFCAAIVRLTYQPKSWVAITLWCAPAVLLSDAISLIALEIFGEGGSPLHLLVFATPVSALVTVATAFPIVWLATRIGSLAGGKRTPMGLRES